MKSFLLIRCFLLASISFLPFARVPGPAEGAFKEEEEEEEEEEVPLHWGPLVSGKTLVLYKDDAEIILTAPAQKFESDLNFYLLDLGVVQGHKGDLTTALVGASMSLAVFAELDTLSDCELNSAVGSVGVALELRAFPNCYTAEECGADGTAEEGTDYRVLAPGMMPLTVIYNGLGTIDSTVFQLSWTFSTNHASFVLVDEEPGDFFLQAVLFLYVEADAGSLGCGAGRSLLGAEFEVEVTDWVITINEDVIVIESPDPGDPLTLSPAASP